MKRITATAKDHRVARHQAQGTGVGRHVGAAFENYADHAQGTADSFDFQSVRTVPLTDDLADRIRQFRDRQ